MNYEEAKGHFKHNKRKSYYMGYWLSLYDCGDSVSLDFYGQRDIIKWYPDGKVVVQLHGTPIGETWNRSRDGGIRPPLRSKGIYSSWSNRSRINQWMPYGWRFESFYYHTILYKNGNPVTTGRECPDIVAFGKKGQIINKRALGLRYNKIRNHYQRHLYRRNKPRRRGQYWIHRARNLYWDRSGCQHRGPRNRYQCEVRRHGLGTAPGTRECGCRVYRKNLRFRYTTQQILNEANTTVRSAWIRLYGVKKFFEDINSSVVAKHDNYELLNVEMTGGHERALRMVCPSTGTTYVHLVPGNINAVGPALDWMYDTPNWLQRVKAST